MTSGSFRSILHAALAGFSILVACVLSAPAAALADEVGKERPHWSFEIKGGNFYPDFDSFPAGKKWSDFYGSDHTWQLSGALGYKLLRWIEVGIEGGRIEDRGSGYAPVNGLVTGRVIYQLYPVSAYVLARAVFREQQWIVPYAGGGYTRMYYRQKIEGQGTVRGSTDGYMGRAGVQLLLDDADRKSADSLYLNYGIMHTYLVLEAQLTRATVESTAGEQVELGGLSFLGGLLFEF